jgi:hypothetical protein
MMGLYQWVGTLTEEVTCLVARELDRVEGLSAVAQLALILHADCYSREESVIALINWSCEQVRVHAGKWVLSYKGVVWL